MKKQKLPLRYATLMRLVRTIHANAVRLFLDACALYRIKSFPSAYALSILAYEELGKMEMVDHVGFEEMFNGHARMNSYRMEHLFSRKMFYSHLNKQSWGVNRRPDGSPVPKMEQRIYDGKLESDKQNALYVGFIAGRIHNPSRFRASHVRRQLRYALQAFVEIADIPFYSITEGSTSASRRRAKKIIGTLQEAFNSCTIDGRN